MYSNQSTNIRTYVLPYMDKESSRLNVKVGEVGLGAGRDQFELGRNRGPEGATGEGSQRGQAILVDAA